MAEEKKKAKAPVAEKAEKENETVESTGPGAVKKSSSWTKEKVSKFARRFTSEADWKVGHPSSYKSAVAHAWVADCKKLFRAPESRGTGSFKRSA